MRAGRVRLVATVGLSALVLTACGGGGADDAEPAAEGQDAAEADGAGADEEGNAAAEGDDEASGEPIPVGIVTSTSGLLGAYGEAYLGGLDAGLDHATDGTGAVDGRPIELEIVDDAGEPDQAISASVDLIGQGVRILAGSVSSGVAAQMAPFAEENDALFISGPAATDAITGINDHTFRSGRQSYQDVAAATSLLDEVDGATVAAFVQDSEFGAGNVAALESVLGEQGAEIVPVEVPQSANEFTPFAQQIANEDPDLVFVAWAGDTSGAMWQTLEQQGILEEYPVTTGLGDIATWPLYGEAGTEIDFLSHYFPGAPDTELDDEMVEAVASADLFTPDGFVAGQMIVHAIEEGDPDDVDSMISALEGWSFEGPKGETTVRASDHALLQPMFTAEMTEVGQEPEDVEVELLETLEPEATAPPEAE